MVLWGLVNEVKMTYWSKYRNLQPTHLISNLRLPYNENTILLFIYNFTVLTCLKYVRNK